MQCDLGRRCIETLVWHLPAPRRSAFWNQQFYNVGLLSHSGTPNDDHCGLGTDIVLNPLCVWVL